MSQIKRAVSMYSLQDSYARGRLDLGGVLEFVTSLDAGVELIGDQMIKGAPNPSEETLYAWDALVDRLQPTLVCNDIFINSTLYKNRVLRPDEQLALLEADLRLSKRLGFSLVRPVSDTAPAVLEAALPLAEKLGVCMAPEIHAGMSYEGTLTAEYLRMMERLQSEYLGIVVDLGIFCQRLPRVWSNYFRSLGATPEVIDWVERCYVENGDTLRVFADGSDHGMKFPPELTSLFRSPIDGEFTFFSTGYENTPWAQYDRWADYVKHIHGKFYEMTDAGDEYSIDYPGVIAHLTELGYDGYIASEYEGQRFVPVGEFVDDTDQVRRHQQYLKSLIDAQEA